MPYGYAPNQRVIGSPSAPTYRPDGTLDEAAMRGASAPQTDAAPTPYQTNSDLSYAGGYRIPGTNTPMSDQAYQQWTGSGRQLATDRDVLGGGKFGVRGWMNDHPLGVIAAFTALAAGGAALAPAGAGGAGGAAGGGAAGTGASTGTGIMGFGGAGTGGTAANLGADLAAVQMGGGAAGSLAASGGITGGAGAFGGQLGNLSGYGTELNRFMPSGGGGGGGSAPMMMPQGGMMGSSMQPQPMNNRQTAPMNQSMMRARPYSRTPVQFRGSTVWL